MTASLWKRWSLRLRLTLWFALFASALLLALLPFVYHLVRDRLIADTERQLGIDWALIEAHLEYGREGGIQWRSSSPATPESPGYAESWFDVWVDEQSVLRHWPSQGGAVLHPPQPGESMGARFYSVFLDDGRPARTFQRVTVIDGREVLLRVFRDESGQRATLRHILLGLALGMPVAIALAAIGGYVMAGRALRPVREMASEARQITSESLDKRLPVPNAHDELGQLAIVFNQTLTRLEASFDSLKRFTADASHELRTPLTALRSVGEISLRRGDDPDELRETIGSMLEESQRLQDLVETLLLLARAESSDQSLCRESVALDVLTRDVCELLEVLASEKRQQIKIVARPGPHVQADPVLLRQALTSLLDNAIRHSPPGSAICVSVLISAQGAVIDVTDQGPGIPPEHREKIFTRFHRIDKARSRADGGTGLGLAIAKLFVEQHGGSIELDCPSCGGSRFRIVLPQGPR